MMLLFTGHGTRSGKSIIERLGRWISRLKPKMGSTRSHQFQIGVKHGLNSILVLLTPSS
jgi:hypothetical protein